MKQTRISRRNFIYRATGLALSLWTGQGLAQSRWAAGMQLDIAFEIVGGLGGRYRAPYVAVWIENEQGLPLRTLALWYLQSPKGARWLNELRRWYRSGNLQDTVSGPTRMPGRYSLGWDGKDHKGNLLGQGEYYVCVEVAREHGPYTLFREKLSLAQSTFSRSYNPGGDLQEVRLSYGKQG